MFSETEIIAIGKAAEIEPDALNSHLIYRGSLTTTEIKAAVLSEIAKLELIPSDGIRIEAKESNFGTSLDYDRVKTEIKENIRRFLGISRADSFRLLRG